MHVCYKGTGLRRGRALNGDRCVAVADDSFPVIATLTPLPVKHKLRPRAVHGEGWWRLFCFAVQLSSTLSTEATNQMQQLLKFITCRLNTAQHVSADPTTTNSTAITKLRR